MVDMFRLLEISTGRSVDQVARVKTLRSREGEAENERISGLEGVSAEASADRVKTCSSASGPWCRGKRQVWIMMFCV